MAKVLTLPSDHLVKADSFTDFLSRFKLRNRDSIRNRDRYMKIRTTMQMKLNCKFQFRQGETMQEVIVLINGETNKINAIRVFHWRNPKTYAHGVAFMDADTKKWVKLFCQDEEEAETLTQKIREGKITDLTAYLTEWNS